VKFVTATLSLLVRVWHCVCWAVYLVEACAADKSRCSGLRTGTTWLVNRKERRWNPESREGIAPHSCFRWSMVKESGCNHH
jgi:hypothetical protein